MVSQRGVADALGSIETGPFESVGCKAVLELERSRFEPIGVSVPSDSTLLAKEFTQ